MASNESKKFFCEPNESVVPMETTASKEEEVSNSESDCEFCECLPCECSSNSDDDDDGTNLEIRNDFRRDINYFKHKYGSFAVTVKRPNRGINEYIVTLFVPVNNLLRQTTANAWGIDLAENINLEIKLSSFYYLDPNPPKISMTQNGKLFRLGLQLTNQLVDILSIENWIKLQNLNKNGGDQKVLSPRADAKPSFECSIQSYSLPLTICDDKLKGKHTSIEDCDTSIEDCGTSIKDCGTFIKDCGTSIKDCAIPVEECDVSIKDSPSLKFLMTGEKSDVTTYTVNMSEGLFVMLVDYIRLRIPTMSDHCVICDRGHIFKMGEMLQPSVCTRALCVYKLQEIGIGSDTDIAVAMGSEIIDMLICFLRAGIVGRQRDIRFKPFPLLYEIGSNGQECYLDPEKPDFGKLEAILSVFPSTKEIVNVDDFAVLRETLESRHMYAFPLLRWIIISNRAHLTALVP